MKVSLFYIFVRIRLVYYSGQNRKRENPTFLLFRSSFHTELVALLTSLIEASYLHRYIQIIVFLSLSLLVTLQDSSLFPSGFFLFRPLILIFSFRTLCHSRFLIHYFCTSIFFSLRKKKSDEKLEIIASSIQLFIEELIENKDSFRVLVSIGSLYEKRGLRKIRKNIRIKISRVTLIQKC